MFAEGNITSLTDNPVLYYYADMVNSAAEATQTLPYSGVEHTVFSRWIEMNASSTSDISNPIYNTVYALTVNEQTLYYIYYIDSKWYPIELKGNGIAYAAVPVYGQVNYTGDLIRSNYE